MKKRNLIISLVLVATTSLFYACGSSEQTTSDTGATYDLLTDDGTGVIFTNYATGTGTPAQFKLFDNSLRTILNGESFPGSLGSSAYRLEYVRTMLVVFGVTYAGTEIDKITCEKSEDTNYQLHFDYDYNADGVYNDNGIYWEDLVNMQGAPLVTDRAFACSGGGKNFTITMFEDNGISDDEFTLYFAFKGERKFRGKLVVTETGKNPSTDGVVLIFE